jgi:4-amino-4-deoxy-L-arabinose transferase-like glycosyltransferase
VNRNHYFILLGIAFLYILTRIIVSIRFPLFFDEAIYIHWAQYIMDDWFWWHVSLTDGKQPLFIWLISIFHRFISDPILAGRFVSVIAGLGSMIGTFLVVKELFGYKTGLIAVILYSIVPFYLLYDSLALMDSLLMTESIFAVYFSLKLTHSFRLRYALLLGITIGLGLLTKSSASFFLYLLPIGVLLFTKYSLRKSLIFFGFLLLSGVIAKGIESTLRMSTYYSVIQSKNNEFVRSLSEVLQDPFTLAMQNGSMIGEWVLDYMGLFLILFALAAFLSERKPWY